MRILLAIHNAYTEYASGAATSMRTIVQWLAEAGHSCHVLSTARFESTLGASLTPHLAELGIPTSWTSSRNRCRETQYGLGGVQVSVIETRHHDFAKPDRAENKQYIRRFNALLRTVRPDLVLTYGAHPILQTALTAARDRKVTTVSSLRNLGYDDRRWFANTDRVLTNSAWLTRHYADTIGLRSTGLPSPIIWSNVQGPEDSRGFVTFVNPAPHKGVALFARLADELGQKRPDIPMLVVQSTATAGVLTGMRGLDLRRYPQILVSPPIARAADLFALTRILLVPSMFQEPFGRVAAEAMINGIPALVSDRGGLPETVEDGAIVLPVPAWMGDRELRVPEANEVAAWFDSVTRLWDDPDEYQRVSIAAQAAAHRLYDEATLRQRYEAYFTAPRPYEPLFADGPFA